MAIYFLERINIESINRTWNKAKISIQRYAMTSSKIYIAGHNGLVGAALVRHLKNSGYNNLLLRSRQELDLTQQSAVQAFFKQTRPKIIFLAAAKVGGIHANNSYPADFIYDNLAIQTNIIDAAYRYGADKLLFLGSSCIYPKESEQPMRESALLSGPLEETNISYAIAKIAGIKMCQAYRQQYGFNSISLMPTNLYGPGDNFDLNNAHVLPALIQKFHQAHTKNQPEVTIWGTGRAKREFLHVDDLAAAALFLMDNYASKEIINVGVGKEISIAELAKMIQKIVGYSGKLHFDHSKPDGTLLKRLDTTCLESLGWKAKISLRSGITATYKWFLSQKGIVRGGQSVA